MAEDYTVAELVRTVQAAVLRVESITHRLESGQYVSTSVFNLTVENLRAATEALKAAVGRVEAGSVTKESFMSLDNRVKTIEGWGQWAFRIVGAAILAAILGLVLKVGGVG